MAKASSAPTEEDKDLEEFGPPHGYVFKYAKLMKYNKGTKDKWNVMKKALERNLYKLRKLEDIILKNSEIIPRDDHIIMLTINYFFYHDFIEVKENHYIDQVVARIANLMGKNVVAVQKGLDDIRVKMTRAIFQERKEVADVAKKFNYKLKARFGDFGDYVDYDYYYDDHGYVDDDGQFAGYNDGDYYQDYYYGDVGGLNDYYRFGKRERNLYEHGYRRQLQDVGGINISGGHLDLLYLFLFMIMTTLMFICCVVFYRHRVDKLRVIKTKNNEEDHV